LKKDLVEDRNFLNFKIKYRLKLYNRAQIFVSKTLFRNSKDRNILRHWRCIVLRSKRGYWTLRN